MSNWKGIPRNIEDYDSFVYLIVCKKNGRRYIGQKTFWNKRSLKPLKGKKRRRISYIESDWRTYYGSSDLLKEDITRYGESAFERFILVLCHTKFDKNYWEAKLQFDNDVLLSDDYYNGLIRTRINNKPKGSGIKFTNYIKMVKVK